MKGLVAISNVEYQLVIEFKREAKLPASFKQLVYGK